MAVWPSIPTVSVGQVADTSWANAVKAAADMAGPSRKRFRCAKKSGTVPSTAGGGGNVAAVSTDTVLFDNDGMCSGGYVNINTAGIWIVMLNVEWIANATGTRSAEIYEVTAAQRVATETKAAEAAGVPTTHQLVQLNYFDANDQIQVRLTQSSGGALGMSPTWWGCSLSGFLLT